MRSKNKGEALEIQVAPHDTAVDYLKSQRIPLGIRNHSGDEIVLEDISLTFQTDYAVPAASVSITLLCDGAKVAPEALEYFQVPVVPTLLYRPATNYCRAVVTYRRKKGKTLSPPTTSDLPNASYLVVKEPPIFDLAQVFVSFKDPEDQELATHTAVLLRRAGLRPYLARNDPRPGADYWTNKIEPAIRSSVALTVVWSPHTAGHDESVVREVTIARASGVPDLLLLQEGAEAPKQYPPAVVEHVRFARNAPWIPFARAIEVISLRIRAGKGL